MTFAPFEVVVVPFPYSDRLAEKRRPALVVSSFEANETLKRVWVAMVTSAVDTAGFGDMIITDLKAAGLNTPSLLRAGKLATIDADRIVRSAGRLSSSDMEAARLVLGACAGF